MATTTGNHPLTYPEEGVKNWYSTFQSFAQAITDDLDNLGTTIIAQVDDSNSNEMLVFSTTATAVNHVQLANAATGNGPALTAIGDDANIDLNITPKGTGNIVLDGLTWPNADGTANQVLVTNGSGALSFATRLNDVVSDTTPQLGGALDVNGQEIRSVSGANIDLHSDNNILMELGDAAGTNKISVRDSAAAEVASVNSDGDISCTDITANSISLTTALAGTSVNINGATAETSANDSDEILIYDASAGANRKMTRGNFLTAAGSTWTLLSTTTASSSATIDLSLTSGYNKYRVHIHGLVPVTDDVDLYARFQTAGGAYRSGASDYKFASFGRDNTDIGVSSSAAAQIEVNSTSDSGLGSAAGEHFSAVVDISSPRSSSEATLFRADMVFAQASGNLCVLNTAGSVATAEDNDEVRFLLSSGNISSGTFKVYGLVES